MVSRGSLCGIFRLMSALPRGPEGEKPEPMWPKYGDIKMTSPTTWHPPCCQPWMAGWGVFLGQFPWDFQRDTCHPFDLSWNPIWRWTEISYKMIRSLFTQTTLIRWRVFKALTFILMIFKKKKKCFSHSLRIHVTLLE